MAGHSKWANIQFRKSAQDKKRGKIFTRLIREITVAARDGGDPDNNPRLRLALERAQAANLPKASSERAVARGSGAGGADACEDVVYEGYAKGGIAVLIESATDNRNRTIAEVRHAFSKHGGAMADAGSVSYLFTSRGEIVIDAGDRAEEALELAIDNGAEDVETEAGAVRIVAEPTALGGLARALDGAGIKPESIEITRVADVLVDVDEEGRGRLQGLIDALEALEDTQSVFTNAAPEENEAAD